jgi:26S proteasome regulatory subunit N10
MEATVVCIDNSEYTRNGDFLPSRFQAQADAVNQLAGAKTGANPENTVGILTCAAIGAKSPKVMVTPTSDLGKVLTALSAISIEGAVNVCKAAQIAQLALKHRQNKNQRQRIVLFIGSPVEEGQVRRHHALSASLDAWRWCGMGMALRTVPHIQVSALGLQSALLILTSPF